MCICVCENNHNTRIFSSYDFVNATTSLLKATFGYFHIALQMISRSEQISQIPSAFILYFYFVLSM